MDSFCVWFRINFWLFPVQKPFTIDKILETSPFSFLSHRVGSRGWEFVSQVLGSMSHLCLSQCKEPTVEWWLCKCPVTWHPAFSLLPFMSLNMLIRVIRKPTFSPSSVESGFRGWICASERKEFCSLVCLKLYNLLFKVSFKLFLLCVSICVCGYVLLHAVPLGVEFSGVGVRWLCANMSVPVLWMDPGPLQE